ncbi:MAG: sugar ABC transporter substrate-binding protein [Thermoleophilia bacterium]|nr:sugar ABC transporter substrate-binding protein [Thermoleophilia bacterium]
MRRLLALSVALLALALAVAGCGGGDDDSGGTATGGTPSGTVRVIMEEVPDTDIVKSLLPEFQKEFPDVDVQVEALPYDQMRDRIVSSFLASDPTYDMIVVDNPWMYDFAKGDFLLPLDDRITAAQDFDHEDFAQPLRDIAEVDGATYGVPFYNYALGLIYRKDLYAQAGLTPPTTLAELKAAAAKLNTGGRAGIAMQPQKGYKIFEEWGNYLFGAGGAIQDADNAVVLDSPEARTALQEYIDIYKASAPKNSLNWAFDESLRAVAGDKAAQMISYNWMLPTLNKADGPAGKLAGKFALAEVPGGKSILGSWSWAIPKNSASPDAAWAFIAWVTSKQHEKERVIAGGAPVRASAMSDPEVWEQGFGEDYYTTVASILEDAAPLADGPNAEEMINVVGEDLNAAVAGQESVDDAISSAASGAQETLDK